MQRRPIEIRSDAIEHGGFPRRVAGRGQHCMRESFGCEATLGPPRDGAVGRIGIPADTDYSETRTAEPNWRTTMKRFRYTPARKNSESHHGDREVIRHDMV